MLNRQNSHHLVNAFRFLKLDAGSVTCTSTQIQMEKEMINYQNVMPPTLIFSH